MLVPRLPPVTDRDHLRGAARAVVTLVEYGDYQCPFCGQAFPVLRDIEARFQRDLAFVFRNFPLTEVHPFALGAALAAEAASVQGRFWAMHDQLFEHQDALEPDMLIAYATELGLDLDRFTTDLAGQRYLSRIRDDFVGGVHGGVNGTPTLFIDGERYDGRVDRASITTAIERARGRHAEAR